MSQAGDGENRRGNECSCGRPHYCEGEVMELLAALVVIDQANAANRELIDKMLRKFHPKYYSMRVRESKDASETRSEGGG